mmetsp:Transcript_21776/g.34943  ORF Transcript_21776/g.34943 Transcript_21776/m.34943 type:complete len:223 (+) Transcript_21776:1628-2296(+)
MLLLITHPRADVIFLLPRQDDRVGHRRPRRSHGVRDGRLNSDLDLLLHFLQHLFGIIMHQRRYALDETLPDYLHDDVSDCRKTFRRMCGWHSQLRVLHIQYAVLLIELLKCVWYPRSNEIVDKHFVQTRHKRIMRSLAFGEQVRKPQVLEDAHLRLGLFLKPFKIDVLILIVVVQMGYVCVGRYGCVGRCNPTIRFQFYPLSPISIRFQHPILKLVYQTWIT